MPPSSQVQSDAVFRAMIDSVPDGILRVNPEGRIVVVNRQTGSFLDMPGPGFSTNRLRSRQAAEEKAPRELVLALQILIERKEFIRERKRSIQ